MSAPEVLRRAATLMRERAAAAVPGPWRIDNEIHAEAIYSANGTDVVSGGRWGGEASVFNDTADAIHIASWHPAVALAVADWLDRSAQCWGATEYLDHQALTVASAYLGGDQ